MTDRRVGSTGATESMPPSATSAAARAKWSRTIAEFYRFQQRAGRRRTIAERRRLTFALLVSLLLHALLLRA